MCLKKLFFHSTSTHTQTHTQLLLLLVNISNDEKAKNENLWLKLFHFFLEELSLKGIKKSRCASGKKWRCWKCSPFEQDKWECTSCIGSAFFKIFSQPVSQINSLKQFCLQAKNRYEKNSFFWHGMGNAKMHHHVFVVALYIYVKYWIFFLHYSAVCSNNKSFTFLPSTIMSAGFWKFMGCTFRWRDSRGHKKKLNALFCTEIEIFLRGKPKTTKKIA